MKGMIPFKKNIYEGTWLAPPLFRQDCYTNRFILLYMHLDIFILATSNISWREYCFSRKFGHALCELFSIIYGVALSVHTRMGSLPIPKRWPVDVSQGIDLYNLQPSNYKRTWWVSFTPTKLKLQANSVKLEKTAEARRALDSFTRMKHHCCYVTVHSRRSERSKQLIVSRNAWIEMLACI
jgi:hypothetical protein